MTTQPDLATHMSPRLDSGSPSILSPDTTSVAEREVLALRAEVLALRDRLNLLERMQTEWASLRAMLPALAQMSPVKTPYADAVSEAAYTSASAEAAEANGVPGAAESGAPSAAPTRRRLLQWGGMAAVAGVAAASGAVLTTQTAHAADGDSLILGQSNTASHATTLDGTTVDGGPVFSVLTTTHFGASAIAGVGGPSGIGVLGIAVGSPPQDDQSAGVLGQSSGGNGVGGQSTAGMDLAAIGTGRLWQKPLGSVGAPAVGSHKRGEQIRDQNGSLYICVADGVPGTWQKVAALDSAYKGGAIGFLPAPIRLLDTRSGSAWPAGSNHTLQVTGVNVSGISVPAGAVGVVGNVTVVRPTGLGDLRLYPAGASLPGTSSINFAAGQIIANGVIVGLDSAGRFSIQVDMPGGTSANVLFDASGFIF